LAVAVVVLQVFQQRALAQMVALAVGEVLAILLAQELTLARELLGKEIMEVSFILMRLLTAWVVEAVVLVQSVATLS
tara:strand:- start:430 stop:660 length:231 start_codon:yes stop_codon:yes gene_type:complete